MNILNRTWERADCLELRCHEFHPISYNLTRSEYVLGDKGETKSLHVGQTPNSALVPRKQFIFRNLSARI